MQKRLIILRYFVIGVFILVGLNIFYLQIIQGAYFRKRSLENRTQVIPLPAPRGKIFTRDGKILVTNRPAFSVLFSGLNLPESAVRESIAKISALFNIPVNILKEKVTAQARTPLLPVHFVEDISRQELVRLSEISYDLPGTVITVESRRKYVYGDFASHIIGYLGEINKEELAKLAGYRPGQIIGKAGIEREFDRELRGIDGGKQIEINALGKQTALLGREEPIPGNNLKLTINFQLQRLAEEALAGKKGAIVVLNPQNGEILAWVSKPSFNPELFLKRLTPQECAKIFADPEHPLLNRAIQGQYPPGSTFKIVTAIAALEEKKITPETIFNCRGEFSLRRGGQVFRCWKEEGHGRIDLHEAIVQSCSVYFYHAGLLVGPDDLAKYAKAFGLGKPTGIGLGPEKGGVVPDPHWKRGVIKRGWFGGDTVNFSIGQGYLLVTPLQMANLIAAVATRGKMYRPYLVKEIISPEGKILKSFEKKLGKEVRLSPKTWEILRAGLTGVVEERKGTGRFVRIKGLKIAGKTGTAENPFGKEHAWFVCFAPVEDPQIAMCVFVENGGQGAVAAVPLARHILKEVASHKILIVSL